MVTYRQMLTSICLFLFSVLYLLKNGECAAEIFAQHARRGTKSRRSWVTVCALGVETPATKPLP